MFFLCCRSSPQRITKSTSSMPVFHRPCPLSSSTLHKVVHDEWKLQGPIDVLLVKPHLNGSWELSIMDHPTLAPRGACSVVAITATIVHHVILKEPLCCHEVIRVMNQVSLVFVAVEHFVVHGISHAHFLGQENCRSVRFLLISKDEFTMLLLSKHNRALPKVVQLSLTLLKYLIAWFRGKFHFHLGSLLGSLLGRNRCWGLYLV